MGKGIIMIKETHHQESLPGLITEFRGKYYFLSNFFKAPQKASYEEGRTHVQYSTNEHFFQACKANTWAEHMKIAHAATPSIAKRMGSINGYQGFKIVLRDNWRDIRLNIMRIGINMKFRQNPELAKLLIATYPKELQEGNWWGDDFWGRCFRKKAGANWVGVLEMELRNNLMLEDI